MQNLFDLQTANSKNSTEFITFKNYGVIKHKFTDEQLAPVWQEVNSIQNNFSSFEHKKNNKNLAGNLKKEYTLETSVPHLNTLISPLVDGYDMYSGFNTSVKNSTLDTFKLKGAWVNFQQKHEFNPNHNHGGFMSFVLWLKIPYNIKDEMVNPSGADSNTNVPAHFQFLYTSTTGEIMSYAVAADKSMENTLMLFPAKMVHTVYPFFTSDDYRISVSGNFYFDN
jgi:hypothetical protein